MGYEATFIHNSKPRHQMGSFVTKLVLFEGLVVKCLGFEETAPF